MPVIIHCYEDLRQKEVALVMILAEKQVDPHKHITSQLLALSLWSLVYWGRGPCSSRLKESLLQLGVHGVGCPVSWQHLSREPGLGMILPVNVTSLSMVKV